MTVIAVEARDRGAHQAHEGVPQAEVGEQGDEARRRHRSIW
jgi:hypothetical protein